MQQKQCKPTPCWVLLMLMQMLLLLRGPQAVLPPEWCPRSPPWSGGEPWPWVLCRHLLLVSRQWAWSLRLPCPQLTCEQLHLLRMHFWTSQEAMHVALLHCNIDEHDVASACRSTAIPDGAVVSSGLLRGREGEAVRAGDPGGRVPPLRRGAADTGAVVDDAGLSAFALPADATEALDLRGTAAGCGPLLAAFFLVASDRSAAGRAGVLADGRRGAAAPAAPAVPAELLVIEDLISESTRPAVAGWAVPLLAPAASTAGAGLLLGAEPSDATSVTPLGLKLVVGSETGMPAAPGAFTAVSAVLEAPNFGAATDAVGFFGVLLGVAACTINKRDTQQHDCLYMASDPADGNRPTLDRLLRAHSTTRSVAACLAYLRMQLLSKAHERRIQSETHLASLHLHALLHPEGCRSLSWSWTSSRTRLVTAFQRETARCPNRRSRMDR